MRRPLFIGSDEFGARISGTIAFVPATVVVIAGGWKGGVFGLFTCVLLMRVVRTGMADPAADAERRSDRDRP
jgi:hypothetical protein